MSDGNAGHVRIFQPLCADYQHMWFVQYGGDMFVVPAKPLGWNDRHVLSSTDLAQCGLTVMSDEIAFNVWDMLTHPPWSVPGF